MKRLLLCLATGICVLSMSMVSFAGQWVQDNNGWYYQNTDNSYPANSWQWIDGKCYYFTPEGYCLINTTTPDGYTVDGSGAWIVNGVIQTQSQEAASENQANLPKEDIFDLTNFANAIYNIKYASNTVKKYDMDIKLKNLTAENRADILNWYQYTYKETDNRFAEETNGAYEEYLTEFYIDDMKNMMEEILGECREKDMKSFEKKYVSKKTTNDTYKLKQSTRLPVSGMNLSADNVSCIIGEDELIITGYVKAADNSQPAKTYTAYFTENSESRIAEYQFRRLFVK